MFFPKMNKKNPLDINDFQIEDQPYTSIYHINFPYQ